MDISDEVFFDDYVNGFNLSEELKKFYQIINDEEQMEELTEEKDLTEIRNDLYKRYSDINLVSLEKLPSDFETIVNEIKKIYSYVSPNKILTSNFEESYEIKKIIDLIYYHLEKLNEMLKIELTELEISNNDRQLKIKNIDFSTFDKKILHEILNKYSDIVLYSGYEEENIIDNYNRQLIRKKDLNDLYRIIKLELHDPNDNKNILKKLNGQINIEINNINNKISYLEDLMIEKSKYEKEFNTFKSYFTNVIAYDDNDYSDVNRVYHIICEDLKFKSLIYYFEENLIKEIEKIKRDETFVYEKIGIKNIKKSLDYISANYMDLLEEEKNTINSLYNILSNDKIALKEIYNKLSQIVIKIWKETITDPYQYASDKDFCFICSNNQFIDEKYQAILITNKMLDRVDDYSDYEIGFICGFNNNILYVTENEDIMTVDYNDMSNLKTPKQIEQEFINFKVCNRMALNGYLTKVSAVYIIDNKDPIKYKKAVELSNQYKLPLIVLKKR